MDNHVQPRVATVIPVYDARYLADALESVFMQSRPPAEVIVVADGPPDPDAVRRAVAPYGRAIRLIWQANAGAAAARNTALAATTADLVALLDADDRWLPHFLRGQLAAFRRDPTLDLSFTDGLYIGATPLAGQTFSAACRSTGDATLASLLAQRCTVLLSSVVARRTALVDAGGFDPALKRGHDFDLWLRMARRGARMAAQSDVLVLRREHGDNLSGSAMAQIERPLAVLEKAMATLALTGDAQLAARQRILELQRVLACERGKALLREGDFPAARRAFADAREGLRAWKLHAARLGLHLCPGLVRRVYLSRTASAMS